MNRTLKLWIASIFSLFLCACVSQSEKQTVNLEQAAKARVELGLGYLAQNDFVQSKKNLDKALAHSPNSYLVHSALAYFYQKQGDAENATNAYLTAIKISPQQGDVLNNYGAFLCSQGKFEQAYAHFEQALQSKNYYQQADTYENMALCAFAQRNTEIYQHAVQKLMNIDESRVRKLPKTLK